MKSKKFLHQSTEKGFSPIWHEPVKGSIMVADGRGGIEWQEPSHPAIAVGIICGVAVVYCVILKLLKII